MATHELAGYDVLDTIGHGARSAVYKVQDRKTKAIFALKHVAKDVMKDERYIEQIVQEHHIASTIDHPCLRKTYRLIRVRKMLKVSEIFLVMEYVDGVTLEQKRLRNIVEFCRICQDAAIGLGVMHEAGYVHSDVKPNNIMLTEDGRVKIIDLGQSCAVGTVKERIQGTPDYIAPEQVKRRELTPRTDVFGVGAMLYWLLTNKHIPTLIPKGPAGITIKPDFNIAPPHEINPKVPLALSTLVMRCISSKPEDRPGSMSVVYERLELAINQLLREGVTMDDSGDVTPTRPVVV